MLFSKMLFLGVAMHVIAGSCFAASWKNSHGQIFEADFVRTEGTRVVFRMEGGRLFTVALLDLSPESQSIIRSAANAPIEDLRSNFGRPWPRQASATGSRACKVVSEDAAKSHYIYESPSYRFHSDSRITLDALRNFTTIFESTRAYLAALPLSLMSCETIDSRSRVLIFGESEAYYRSGGPQGSAGCFLSQHRLVLVPMESLGLIKGGTGYSRDVNHKNQVLIHELVHQLTPAAYYSHGSKGWFTEGLAEYVAVTPYNTGYFRPDIHGNAVKQYVTAFGEEGKGGRNLGAELIVPRLRDFMLMDYRRFSGAGANLNYGFGLLLTHYFFHMEGDGRARAITAFLKGLHEGKTGEDALAELLGNGRFEKLEAEIAAAWAKKGITIRFGQ
ncbi:hypothetical protein ACFSSA_06780 [Luteolibacter algae]|uniref:DUF1570 domain-containing protein n=1 Tax=Luteolibacter algae TaxID=454151 RepID=A0ABW5D5P6_9BACT